MHSSGLIYNNPALQKYLQLIKITNYGNFLPGITLMLMPNCGHLQYNNHE